jgi:heme A synthase
MSETEKTVDQPVLVKMMAWIAAIAFFALLVLIVYFSATYEPPEEEALCIFKNLIS